LDTDTLDLLEDLVSQYAGTLLLVSHDRAFLDNVVTSTLVFEGDGRVNEYVGGYADWLRQSRGKPGAGVPAKSAAREGVSAARTEPAPVKPARRLSNGEKRELAALPETIQRLEGEQERLQGLTAEADFFKKEPAEAAQALKRLTALAAELEAAYARWASLEALAS
jgi:ATP-binding cassette subfamily F protein uup